uniref:Uncharacterized protein n=1 Tax=Anguilla anguilla TaxID=7936 RepID=A0A0E9VAX2_ANGAN
MYPGAGSLVCNCWGLDPTGKLVFSGMEWV